MINPTPEMIQGSYVKDYETLAHEVAQNPEEFWGKIAQELGWYKPWDKVLDWQYPYAKTKQVDCRCRMYHLSKTGIS